MGAWGHGPFENDGAGDLLAGLRHGDVDLDGLAWAFEDEDYLEVDGGQIAVALAELVVRLRAGEETPDVGDPAVLLAAMTPERTAWLRRQVERTIADAETSELYELWAEADLLDEWLTATRATLERLG